MTRAVGCPRSARLVFVVVLALACAGCFGSGAPGTAISADTGGVVHSKLGVTLRVPPYALDHDGRVVVTAAHVTGVDPTGLGLSSPVGTAVRIDVSSRSTLPIPVTLSRAILDPTPTTMLAEYDAAAHRWRPTAIPPWPLPPGRRLRIHGSATIQAFRVSPAAVARALVDAARSPYRPKAPARCPASLRQHSNAAILRTHETGGWRVPTVRLCVGKLRDGRVRVRLTSRHRLTSAVEIYGRYRGTPIVAPGSRVTLRIPVDSSTVIRAVPLSVVAPAASRAFGLADRPVERRRFFGCVRDDPDLGVDRTFRWTAGCLARNGQPQIAAALRKAISPKLYDKVVGPSRPHGSMIVSFGSRALTKSRVPTLGLPMMGQGGYGQVRPRSVNNGGDSMSFVTHVHWVTWGGPMAVGYGVANWMPPHAKCTCGSVPRSAKVIATNLGHCQGQLVYRSFSWFFPEYNERFRHRSGSSLCRSRAY
jgi:hypothetical protein